MVWHAIKAGFRSLGRLRFVVALPILAIPAVLPLLTYGPPGTPDALVHFVRVSLLDYHLRQGTFYPRWLPEAMLGHGYPVFNFYAPASYYVAEALRLLGLSHIAAFTGAYILFVLLAGYGTYLLASDVFGVHRPWAALVAATAYMYAPYLMTNIYVRGAYAEAAAQAVLPWILWSYRRVLRARQPAHYVLPAALSLGLLAITHNVTLIFLPPVLLIYLAIHWRLAGCDKTRLAWAGAALALALGASAFFWLPLIFEQRYIVDRIGQVANQPILGIQAWRWSTFLDRTVIFDYATTEPYQLGLAQAIVAGTGLLISRRRDAEWVFFAVLAVASGLFMGSWTLRAWYGIRILTVAQFPWRLLSIMTLPLAVLAGGVVCWSPRRPWTALAGLALLGLIIAANHPEMKEWGMLASRGTNVNLAVEAQAESLEPDLRGAVGLQEFTPRWVQDPLKLQPAPADTGAAQVELKVDQGNAYGLTAHTHSVVGGPLRFGSFYFPGWQVILDGRQVLAPYPSTSLGLLTVDLPAGDHSVQIGWRGTLLERAAGWCTVLALAALAWLTLRSRGPRWSSVPAMALPLLGLWAFLGTSALQPVQQPPVPIAADGVSLAGCRVEQSAANALDIHPYWYVAATPPDAFQAHWVLQDETGLPVAEVTARPYFNTTLAADWPGGTLQPDAYRLALPAGLPAGHYRLAVRPGASPAELAAAPAPACELTLTRPVPAARRLPQPLDVAFGNEVRLVGYSSANDSRAARVPAVRAGQTLTYTLYWQGRPAATQSYLGNLRLTNRQDQAIASVTQWPGPWFSPTLLWNTAELMPDTYLLRVDPGAPPGLYWPWVYLSQPETGKRLPVRDTRGQDLGDHFALPPIKVVGPPLPAPQHTLNVRVGDLARLTGYSLSLPAGGLAAGTPLTLTLYFRCTAMTEANYSLFVHLSSPASGMAAQSDGLIQDGANPTWAWEPGELIGHTAPMRIADGARPGRYALAVGLYDQQHNGVRIPLFGADGKQLAEDSLTLAELDVN